MFGVCYRYDLRSDIQDQWEHVLSNFGLTTDRVWVRGAPEDWQSYLKAPKIDTLADIAGTRPIVVLQHPEAREFPGTVSLVDYVHPADAIYVFGADNVILTEGDDLGGRAVAARVFIPTVALESYSFVAAAMTLYDRFVKNG